MSEGKGSNSGGLILPVTDYAELAATAEALAANRFDLGADGFNPVFASFDPDADARSAVPAAGDPALAETKRDLRKTAKRFLRREEEWTLTDLYGPRRFRPYRIRIKSRPEHMLILGTFLAIGVTGFAAEAFRIALEGMPHSSGVVSRASA